MSRPAVLGPAGPFSVPSWAPSWGVRGHCHARPCQDLLLEAGWGDPDQKWPLAKGPAPPVPRAHAGPAYPGPEVEPVLGQISVAQRLVEFARRWCPACLEACRPGRPRPARSVPHGGWQRLNL